LEKENKQISFKSVFKKLDTKKVYLIVGLFFGILWALTNSIMHSGDPLSIILGFLFYIPAHLFMWWIIAKSRFDWWRLDKKYYEEEKKVDLVSKK
jgi:hypothetical protein